MKKLIITVILAAVIIFGVYKLTSNPSTSQSNLENPDLVLYWGVGCPHCEVVKEYLEKNNISEKLKIDQKEIYYNKNNQKELGETVRINCPDVAGGQGIGIPLLFNPKDKTCFVGDQPIIDYISQTTGQKQ